LNRNENIYKNNLVLGIDVPVLARERDREMPVAFCLGEAVCLSRDEGITTTTNGRRVAQRAGVGR
jgi:hypothetical protein